MLCRRYARRVRGGLREIFSSSRSRAWQAHWALLIGSMQVDADNVNVDASSAANNDLHVNGVQGPTLSAHTTRPRLVQNCRFRKTRQLHGY